MASLNAFDMFQPTLTINTPTMALDILNHEDFDDFDCKVIQISIRNKSSKLIKSLDFMILGGAPVTPALVNLSNEKIPSSKVIVGYGMTGESFKP